ncbi:MAG: histidine phosphatase family protein [Eubacteriales bacterium]|nr:histidine phosphatase family protein [Eubacteriales bacterium]
MLLYMIRHGVTEWNRLKKVQGAMDIPLAEEGIRLARLTGQALKNISFDLCFTSPLLRARQTAECIVGDRGIPVIPDERIQEINFGVLEGTQFKDQEGNVISKEMDVFFKNPICYQRPENGEDIRDILDRTRDFWEEKIHDPDLQDKTILISTHGCAMRALQQNIYREPENFWHGNVPPNCSVNIAEVIDGEARFLAEDKVYTG